MSMGKRRMVGKKPVRMTPQIMVMMIAIAMIELSRLNSFDMIVYFEFMSVSCSMSANTTRNIHIKATKKRILSKAKLKTLVVTAHFSSFFISSLSSINFPTFRSW